MYLVLAYILSIEILIQIIKYNAKPEIFFHFPPFYFEMFTKMKALI